MKLLPILIAFFILCGNAYPWVDTPETQKKTKATLENHLWDLAVKLEIAPERPKVTTGKYLWDLAVKLQIIPEKVTQEYLDELLNQKKAIKIWIAANRESKLKIVRLLRDRWSEQGITITMSDDWFVDMINWYLYESLQESNVLAESTSSLLELTRLMAIYENCYDDGSGRNQIELIEEYAGKEVADKFRAHLPEIQAYLDRKGER